MTTTTDNTRSDLTTGDQRLSPVADVLKAARALIEKPENWTQGAMSRNADGSGHWWDAEGATCFCLMGAIARAAARRGSRAQGAIVAIRSVIGSHLIAAYNDIHTHDEIIAALDRAIARATNSTLGSPVEKELSNEEVVVPLSLRDG